MKIEFDVPPGLDEACYQAAARAAREAAVLRLFEQHAISAGRAAEELAMALEDFLKWASAKGVAVFDLDEADLSREVQAALDAAETRR